jgi:predicted nucleic acid-binding protein
MQFLTTDVFLTFLTETDTPRAEAARAVFTAVEAGKEKITTSPVVLYKLVTTLHSPAGYNQLKEPIIDVLSKLLSLRSFTLDNKQVWLDALTLWQKQPIEFTDAYNRAYARHHGISFFSPTTEHISR